MTPARRTRYLKALGVETWVERSAQPVAEPEKTLATELPVHSPRAERVADITAPAMAVSTSVPPLIDVPHDWPGLKAMVRDCPRCKLCKTRTQTVFGVGMEDAPLLVVGEGPGADEDARGEPFVGRAGQLLDQMLLAIGRSRATNTYIANVVKCRPPGNRDPEADEVEACRPYLDRQIQLIKPRLIVGLGRTAAQRLLQTDLPLSKLRGPLHHYGPENTPVLITYHPAYLLRSPREKAKSWEDLKRIHRLLTAPA